MIKKILEFFIHRTALVNIIGAVICLVGLVTVLGMKRDLHPPLQFPTVTIDYSLRGASPAEIESLVTTPIEEALGSMTGLKKVSSSSFSGSGQIRMEFDYSVDDINAAIETIRSRVDKITYRLPTELRPIQISQDKMDEVFLGNFMAKNFDPMNANHRSALNRARTEIAAINGVVRTDLWTKDRHLFIRFKSKKLEELQLSLGQIQGVLRDYFSHYALGQIQKNENEWSVQFETPTVSVAALEALPISTNRVGQTLRISDVAKVEWDSWEQNSIWLFDGEEIAELEVHKDTTSDSITLYEKVRDKVNEIDKNLPRPLTLQEQFDGPRFIRKQLAVLGGNGLTGFILVIFILAIFLNWKIALITAWGLPVAYLGTFILLSKMGIAIDLLSIVGMILVVGILVDDAIIVAEKYSSYLGKGLRPKEAASLATRDLIVPVTGTIVTTIVAFIPIITIKDNLTWFLIAVPLVICSSLVLSWFECFFILPNHLAHFVKEPPKERTERFFEKFRSVYLKVLQPVIRYRYLAIVAVLSLVAGSVWIASKKLQHSFNISIGSEQIRVYATLKKSDSLDETRKAIEPINNWLKTFPKEQIEYSWTGIGNVWIDGVKKTGFRYARITLGINGNEPHPIELRKKILPIIQEKLKEFESANFEALYAEERKRGQEDYKKDMVKVFIDGNESEKFLLAEKEIISAGKGVQGISEPKLKEDETMESWSFSANTPSLARYKISRASLASQLRSLIGPDLIAETRVGGELVSILTELDKNGQNPSFEDLAQFEVRSDLGTSVPLRYLGKWEKRVVEKTIDHKNRLRTKTVELKFDPEKLNIESAIEKLEVALASVRQSLPGFKIQVGNANEQDEENRNWTMKVALYSLLGVLLVLFFFTGSLTQPLVVIMPVPLGIMGTFWALWAHNMSLTLMAMIGLLGVIGVAVNDSIVMVHHINRLRDKDGRVSIEKIMLGASSRLRAIFLTSLTTVVGVMPTAYGLGGESGFTQPVTFAMGWGLISSTLMTLLILPALLVCLEDAASAKDWVLMKLNRKKQPTAFLKEQPYEVDHRLPPTNPEP